MSDAGTNGRSPRSAIRGDVALLFVVHADRGSSDRARPRGARWRDRARCGCTGPAPDDEPAWTDRRREFHGTGKTRTLQVIAEQLSAAGVAVFAADVKGDVSGIAVPGSDDGPARKRAQEFGIEPELPGFPVEYLSLGGIGPGVPVRATVSDSDPSAAPKVLGSNQTQERDLTLVFHFQPEGAPAPRSLDLRALLTFLDSDAGKDELRGIGGLSSRDRGSSPPFARRTRGGRRKRFLRRAAARHRRPRADGTGRPPGSSRVSSFRRCRTARGCGRRFSCGSSPSSLSSFPRSEPRQAAHRVLPRRGAPTCSTTRARRSSSRSRRPCG